MASTTDKIQTLHCKHGEGHDWTRPAQRGKPPTYCPEHKPTPGRSDAQIARAMQRQAEGVENEIAKRDREVTGGNIDPEQAAKLAKAREAAAKAREERKVREAQEATQNAKDELARIIASMPEIEATYETALAKAIRTNKLEDWRAADGTQSRIIGMITRRRALQQVTA